MINPPSLGPVLSIGDAQRNFENLRSYLNELQNYLDALDLEGLTTDVATLQADVVTINATLVQLQTLVDALDAPPASEAILVLKHDGTIEQWTLEAGDNITITPDTGAKKWTIAVDLTGVTWDDL